MHYQVVFIIHGVGDQKVGYSNKFQKKLSKLVKKYSSVSKNDVTTIYKEIRWSQITQRIQDKLAKADELQFRKNQL